MNTPTIIHFSPFSDLAGANRSMMTLVRQLGQRDKVLVMLLRPGRCADELISDGVETHVLFEHGLPRCRALRWVQANKRMYNLLQQHDTPILHCHSATGIRYIWAAARLHGSSLVCHQRDNYRCDYFHYGLGRADHIIAISEAVLQTLPVQWRQRCTVIHNAVVLPADCPRLFPEGRGPVIGMAGRCTAEKGADLFVEGAIDVLRRHDARFELWGFPETGAKNAFAEQIRKMVRAAGDDVQRRIAFHGFRSDIQRFYENVDIVVVPSRFAEPFGRVAIEAMAFGRVLIAANHGGLSEIVSDDENGLLFSPGDVGDLVHAIERLLQDRQLCERLALTARNDARTKFSPHAHADVVRRVYRGLLER